jgi:hypothetical protein
MSRRSGSVCRTTIIAAGHVGYGPVGGRSCHSSTGGRLDLRAVLRSLARRGVAMKAILFGIKKAAARDRF